MRLEGVAKRLDRGYNPRIQSLFFYPPFIHDSELY